MMILSLPLLSSPVPQPCKICGGDAPLLGAVDFNKYCSDSPNVDMPAANVLIAYNRCRNCGFVFSTSFDRWSHAEFRQYIYNQDYALIDPDYAERRPVTSLTWLETLFGEYRSQLPCLDYGGGNGRLAELMRRNGFTDSLSYDPIADVISPPPSGFYDVVSCFEVLEHVSDPLATIQMLCRLAENGVILFSTLVQPDDFGAMGLFWPYVAPRNGHISLFSQAALRAAFEKFGFKVAYFDQNKHLAYRVIPTFARGLFNRQPEMLIDPPLPQ